MKNYTPTTKFYACCIVLIFFMMPCLGQNVAINEDGSLPNPKAILDVKSYNKGILIPRMSTADRLAMQVAPTGLLVFDTTTMSFWYSRWNDSMVIWNNLVPGTSWGVYGNRPDSNQFLGTTNRMALMIKVDAVAAGCIDPVGRNTFWGFQSGTFTPAYRVDTPGIGNTGTGSNSLYYNKGSYNTAAGSNTMQNNRTGSFNAATGAYSLYNNTTGGTNTANGSSALYANTTGSLNTAVGGMALYNNRTGSFNTGIGYNTSLTRDSFSNATAIGYGAVVNASNKVRLGNSAVTSIEGAVAFSVVSDGRFKYSVKEDVKGLDFILQLRPVTYQFDIKRYETQTGQPGNNNENKPAINEMEAAYKEAAGLRRSGFIAQEVEKAANKAGYDFSGIIKPQSSDDHYSLSYESFVVPMVKAIQELNDKVEKLERENKQLKQLLQKK
jgi:trimeric autotransporter adhesin